MRRAKIEHHGMRYTKEYKTWDSMKERCTNKNCSGYASYGGRGIKVCERWRNSFINFYEDMGEKPTPKHTLDRIDGNGDYTPGNCRWATWSEQNLNRTFKNKPYINGVHIHKPTGKFKVSIRVNNKQIHLGYFPKLEDAILARKNAEKEINNDR